MMNIPVEWLRREWVCQVVRSGYHNGARCTPTEPHDAWWGCCYRWECSLTDDQAAALGVIWEWASHE